jgi:hypothetical protein
MPNSLRMANGTLAKVKANTRINKSEIDIIADVIRNSAASSI